MPKKPVVPLADLVSIYIVAQRASGGAVDDAIYPIVDTLTGKPNVDVLSAARDAINHSVGHISHDPLGAFIDGATAAAVVYGVRLAAKNLGIPASVDIGICRIQIR